MQGSADTDAKKLEGTTVDNDENMGAAWYRHCENGPKYLALTDWNDQMHPEEGGHQYEIFKMNPPGEGGPGKGDPFYQPFGNPMTSRDSNGQNTEGNKAKETGTPIDITWLQRILQFLTPSIGRKKNGYEKADELKGKGKTIAESSDTDAQKKEEENRKKALKEQDQIRAKGRNTFIDWNRYDSETGAQATSVSMTIDKFMEEVSENQGDRFEIVAVSPNDPSKPFHTKAYVEDLLK